METSNKLRLRLRFYHDVQKPWEEVRRQFEVFANQPPEGFKISVCDQHIWIHIVGNQKRYWSPHLHLELEPKENHTHIRGLFGPDPTLWTFFMFLHFLVAGVFTIFGMVLYSKFSLRQPYGFDLLVMVLMVSVWFLLYFIGRQVRSNGYGQMDELEQLFLKIVN